MLAARLATGGGAFWAESSTIVYPINFSDTLYWPRQVHQCWLRSWRPAAEMATLGGFTCHRMQCTPNASRPASCWRYVCAVVFDDS